MQTKFYFIRAVKDISGSPVLFIEKAKVWSRIWISFI